MAQVPYNPVPQADPGATLTETHPDIPAAAFGGEIAHAITGFGRAAEGAGNAIFDRAMQLQQQNNQAEARKATADYTIEVGKLAAQYNTLSGDDAVKAMPQYGKALKELREKYKSGMTTTTSRNMFDNESLGTMSHAIINGASHSAKEHKVFVNQSYDGRIKSRDAEISLNPRDELLVKKNTAANEKDVREYGRLNGRPPEAVENDVREAKSASMATQIEAVGADNDLEARRIFLENKDELTPAARKKLDEQTKVGVRSTLTTQGAKDLVTAHTDADGNLTITQKELFAKAEELVKPYKDTDEKISSLMQSAVQTQLNRDKYVRKTEIAEANETLAGLMVRGVPNLTEAKKDPSGGLAFKSLPSTEQEKWIRKYQGYTDSMGRKYNEEVMKQMQGMKENANTLHEFLEIDPTNKDLNLSRSNIDTVIRWQREARKEEGKSGKANTYINLLEGHFSAQMGQLDLMNRTKNNKEKYDQFTGSMMAAIDAWKEEKKSKSYPTDQQFLKDIAPILMKQSTKDDFWSRWTPWPNKEYGHQIDKTGKEYKSFVEGRKSEALKRGESPDEFEIDREYTAIAYKAIMQLQKAKEDLAKGLGKK